MNLQEKKVLFLGDSITEGAAASCEENIYHQVLKRKFNLAEAKNYGVSGTRIARNSVPSQKAEFDRDFVLRADEMENEADLVVVFGGTNDFGHGDAPLGKFGDDTVYTFYGACKCLLEKLCSRYGKDKIVVLLPLRRWDENSVHGDGTKKPLSPTLVCYVDALRKSAENFGVHIVDLWDDKQLNPNLSDNYENFFFDGLHPNDAGHALLAGKIAAFLEKL